MLPIHKIFSKRQIRKWGNYFFKAVGTTDGRNNINFQFFQPFSRNGFTQLSVVIKKLLHSN